MSDTPLPRIMVVDDEEAILETMTFTFMDVYEVLTSVDARAALDILDENAPVSVVITDQRMPKMSGVEFLTEVFARHPLTVRIMLTGFADADATIQAINDGHVWAYISKPWDPDQLKTIVKRAVEHHQLALENQSLAEDMRRANFFLEAVMDRLDTGAIAVDEAGIVRASNKPARQYLGLAERPRNTPLSELLAQGELETLRGVAERLEAEDNDESREDVDLVIDGSLHRLRVGARKLSDEDGSPLGRVLLLREISHEPMRRRFEEIVGLVSQETGELRAALERALEEMDELATTVRASAISSPSMAELGERASRTQTAIQNWLDVDDLIASQDYPDVQMLLDRMRVAQQRWPKAVELPQRVEDLGARVEAYYESGENSKQRVL
jgi:FixJ family two-component response regulator